jgi:hypothetical protein
MRTHTNTALLRNRVRISLVYMFASMGFLIGGFLASLSQSDPTVQYVVSTVALVIGLLLWARNQRYLARWGPRNRQDAVLQRSLRALDDHYTLFSFPGSALPDYVLVGPMGALMIVPRAVTGTVTCYEGRWRNEENRSALARALLWFVHRPSLGDPGREAQQGIESTYRRVRQQLDAQVAERVRVDAIVVLTHPGVELSQRGCPVPAILLKSLRGHVRRLPKILNPREAAALAEVFEGA